MVFWFLQVFSDQYLTNLKIFALVTYAVCAVPLNCNEVYESCLVQSGNSLVALLPVETKKSEGSKDECTR